MTKDLSSSKVCIECGESLDESFPFGILHKYIMNASCIGVGKY